ncbi:hypothetical protein [Nitrosomonas supralitoralis]|uniref:hypothetical protein n=1 Tax=Nitrosomonas supralitoralis TaxID=2116706 RepID=UPI001A8F3AE7|nr:hypothetical protein [Nitrosomonas supralitoralis]
MNYVRNFSAFVMLLKCQFSRGLTLRGNDAHHAQAGNGCVREHDECFEIRA